MSETNYQIFDTIFKKILTLSNTAVINLINGLFDTDYPTDSTITYNWTEFNDQKLKRILADTILTINGTISYHMEAQIEKDYDIVFRVFQYGYSHAELNHIRENDVYWLHFPEPVIIYLYSSNPVPDTYSLELDFGSQGTFTYQVPVMKYQKITTEELNSKKMVILIPFSLLRLQDAMKESRNDENKSKLIALIKNDIIGSIDSNLAAGNITLDDARKLKEYAHKLYRRIYFRYHELEDIHMMTDETFMTNVELMIQERDKLEEKFIAKLAEKDSALAKQSARIAELEAQLASYKNK